MKDGKFLFPAVCLIAMILGAESARGGSITVPGRDVARSGPLLDLIDVGLPGSAAATLEDFEPSDFSRPGELLVPGNDPASEQAAQVPEPASMGLFGIGITSLITLRRFRKYFS
jgi:hypothetical protein